MLIKSNRIYIRNPIPGDSKEFIEKVNSSRNFLYPWIDIKADIEYFNNYIKKLKGNNEGYFICSNVDSSIMGVIKINEIVRGIFQSGYLGFYIFSNYSGKGYMYEGMSLAIEYAFKQLGLHRLEANIQPENKSSIKLVKRLGFLKEGYSPRYLKIAGKWRDHEHWAILKD